MRGQGDGETCLARAGRPVEQDGDAILGRLALYHFGDDLPVLLGDFAVELPGKRLLCGFCPEAFGERLGAGSREEAHERAVYVAVLVDDAVLVEVRVVGQIHADLVLVHACGDRQLARVEGVAVGADGEVAQLQSLALLQEEDHEDVALVVVETEVLLEFLNACLEGAGVEVLVLDDGVVLLDACVHDFRKCLPDDLAVGDVLVEGLKQFCRVEGAVAASVGTGVLLDELRLLCLGRNQFVHEVLELVAFYEGGGCLPDIIVVDILGTCMAEDAPQHQAFVHRQVVVDVHSEQPLPFQLLVFTLLGG